MLIENQYMFNKSIVVAVLGLPNSGKSSLINHLLGFDLSIVSPLPQTTRNHFQCAVHIDDTEIVLVDTPGVHRSNQEMNLRMNGQARFGSEGADLNLILLDSTYNIKKDFQSFIENFKGKLGPTWIVLTKSDLKKVSEKEALELVEMAKPHCESIERVFSISTVDGHNVNMLTASLCDEAKEGHHLFPDGEISNKNERFFAAEYIREQANHLLKEELPYEIAVVIEDFKDVMNDKKERTQCEVAACILVNRPSQRAIVVGRQGQMIKEIGTRARKKMEVMSQCKVHLNLHVKVSPKWFKNNYVLEEIGLERTQDSTRVWRQR